MRFRSSVRAGLSFMLLVAASASTRGQSPALQPGAVVRFAYPHAKPREATVLSLSPDSLVVTVGQGAITTVRFASIDRLDLQVPRTRARGAIRDAAWGAAWGFLGAGFGSADPGACRRDALCSRSPWLSTLAGTLEMGAIGAVIGAVHPGVRWMRIGPPPAGGA